MGSSDTLTVETEPPRPPSARTGVRCREVRGADRDAIIGLLREGFPRRDRPYWVAAFERLDAHEPPPGLPRYGFMLESGGAAVGVLLLISAAVPSDGRDIVRSNLSSWYVRPDFRMYASMLVSRVVKLPADTFINVSPAEPTWPTIEAQGFRRFSGGAVAAIPALSLSGFGARVRPIGAAGADELGITDGELRLLQDHEAHGCISLCVAAADGARPFVFRRRTFSRFPAPCAHLVYCRRIRDLAGFAGPLGRHLARRGLGWLLVSSDERLDGLAGRRFADRLPMYAAGAIRPRPGDLAYTEAALFGF